MTQKVIFDLKSYKLRGHTLTPEQEEAMVDCFIETLRREVQECARMLRRLAKTSKWDADHGPPEERQRHILREELFREAALHVEWRHERRHR